MFSIPFINRIDNILSFDYLSYNNVKEIINKELKKIKDKFQKKNIKLKVFSGVIDEIIDSSNYKEFGARKINKIIKNDLENIIINDILDNKEIINIKSINKDKIMN